MKNSNIPSLLLAGLFVMSSMGQACSAPLGSHVAAKTSSNKTTITDAAAKETTTTSKTATKKAEGKILPPAEEDVSWTPAGSNSRLSVFYDAHSLKYNKNTGVITAWTKWEYKSTGPEGLKAVWLLSHYDVRVKVFSDLYFVNYSSGGKVLKEGPAPDQSWAPISVNTLGEDVRAALNNYLISH